MLKKIKKYKLSLFLLAMVCMLSIYYVMIPEDNKISKPVINLENTTTRYALFAEKRMEITEKRNEEVATYEEKMTDASLSVIELENYLNEIQTITTLTEKEVYLESLLKGMGFADSLVYLVEDGNLSVSILTDDFDAKDYILVAKEAKEEFGKDTLVTVSMVKMSS